MDSTYIESRTNRGGGGGGGVKLYLKLDLSNVLVSKYTTFYATLVENIMNLSNNDMPAYLIILQVIDKKKW